MAVKTQISKWGNSLGVRIPKWVAREAGVEFGDTVDVAADGDTIVIRPTRPAYTLEELVGRISPRNRHAEIDWGTPAGDETW